MKLTTNAILRRLAIAGMLILSVSTMAIAEGPVKEKLTKYEAMLLGEASGDAQTQDLKRLEEVGQTYSRLTLRNVFDAIDGEESKGQGRDAEASDR